MGKANKSIAKFASSAARMGSLLSFGVTAPLLALGKSAFDTFAVFENSMLKVKAVTQATSEEFKMLTSEAKRLGSTTQFTAQQVADLQLVLGRKGFDATAIKEMQQSVLDLALATGEDLNIAAKVVGTSIKVFGKEASDATKIANTLALATTKSDIQLNTFAASFANAGAGANAVGVDLEELAAMMGVLMENGIKAGRSGSGLNGIFVELNKSGTSFSDALDQVTKGGLSLNDATELVGKNFNKQLLILAKNRDRTKELTREYIENNTALGEMAALMGGGALAKVTLMNSAIEGMKIEIGALISEAIMPIIGFIREMAENFQYLNDTTKNTILRIAGLAAVIGPILIIISLISSVIAVVATEAMAMAIAIVAGIYLVIQIVDRFIRIFSGIGQFIGDNIKAIAERFKNFSSSVKNFFIKSFTEAMNFIDKFAQKIGVTIFELGEEPIFDEIIPDDQLTKFTKWSDSVKKSEKRIDDLTQGVKDYVKSLFTIPSGSLDDPIEKTEFVKSDLDFSSEYEKSLEIDITPKSKFSEMFGPGGTLDVDLKNMAGKNAKFCEKWGSSLNLVNDIFSQNLKNQSIRLDNEHAKQAKSIENSMMTDEDKSDAMIELDKKTAEKRAVIQRKAAKLEKAAAIASAVMNGAVAVSKVFGQTGILGIGLAPIVGSLVAAQVAMIASQPIPQFAQGGLVTGATMGLVGEGRGTTMSNPEVIAPLDKLKAIIGDSGGGGTIIPDVRITGDDLLIVFDRANRRKSRR